MAKKKKETQEATPETPDTQEATPETQETQEATPETQEAKETQTAEPATGETPEEETVPEKDPWEEKYNHEHDARLRLAAEYDNYRKRTMKEKDASYGNGKSDAVAKILPVYDNLERALKQETQDAAYKKGVELTMTELTKILTSLGVEIFGEVGDTFDPNFHNAVMRVENEELGENVIAQVFQKGFKIGGKVIRFAMVQVAN